MSTTPPDTQQPPPPGPDSGPRVGWDEIRDLASIRRTTGDRRRVAGVAGGLARHLDVDPLIVRVAFVVLTFFGGAGLLLYVACWLLVPEDGSDWARVALDRRSRTVALVLVGALVLVILAGHTWWGSGYPWGLLIAAGVIALIATAFPRRDRGVSAAQSITDPGAVPAESPVEGPTQTYVPPPAYVEQPRPVNPRKKGPILFWFALALMAVALGVLGVVDLAGASVAPSAYPALVLALSGGFLLLGAFWGRAGGLILVGLLAAATTVGATVGDRWDPRSTTVVPADAAQVQSSYSMDVGELVVDLSEVTDPQALDGREITVTGNVGHLEIRVPADVTVVANTHVTGVGGINAFDRSGGGVDTALTAVRSGGPGAPRLVIDVDLHVGGIDVHADAATRRSLP